MAADNAGTASKRIKKRGVQPENDTPFSPQAIEQHGAWAVRSYRCAFYGLIPGLGLLLCPVAIVMALLTYLKNRRDPEPRGLNLCKAAIILGALVSLTQWAGLALILHGLAAP